MRFFDPLQHHREFIAENKPDWRPPRWLRRAQPRGVSFVRCIAFIAAPALVATMLAAGLPVRTHPLESDRYVVPEASVNEVTFRDLLRRKDFIFLSTVIIVTSGTSQTSPADWDNSNNTVEGIGGGGSGARHTNVSQHSTGGGGGEYRKIANFSVATPGTTNFTYTIGAGGNAVSASTNNGTNGNDGAATTFNTSSLIANPGIKGVSGSGSQNGGAGGTGGTGAAGNADGGRGGNLTGASGTGASGAGGAGGPNGAGVAGSDSALTSTVSTAGGAGDNGSGGAGGPNGAAPTSNGSDGAEWGSAPNYGSGGGGGGRNGNGTATSGSGGNYGGGGGACQAANSGVLTTSGAGAPGIIVITYTPAGGARPGFLTLLGVS